jgi:hypothetical protein
MLLTAVPEPVEPELPDIGFTFAGDVLVRPPPADPVVPDVLFETTRLPPVVP